MFTITQAISLASLEFSLIGISLLSLIFAIAKPLSSSKTLKSISTIVLATLAMCSFAYYFYTKGFHSNGIKLLLAIVTVCVLQLHAAYTSERIANFSVYFLALCSIIGTLFAISARDFLSLYLAFETISFVGYITVSLLTKRRFASESAIKYFVIGGVSSAIMLFGISFIYGASNSIDFSQISTSTLATIGTVLFLCGIFFKLTAFPFHFWASDVYSTTSLPTLGIITTLPKIAGLIALANLLPSIGNGLVILVLSFVAITSMFVGSVGGIFQAHINRIIAYSGIANIGFILALYTVPNFSNSVLYEFIIIYIIGVLFLITVLLAIQNHTGYNGTLESLQGLHKTNPMLAFLLTIALLNIAGIPPLSGFFTKYVIIKHLILQQNFYMPLAIVSTSVISVFYYLKIIKNMYISSAEQKITETKSVHIPLLYKLILAVLYAFAMLYFAIEFTPFMQSLIHA